MKDKIYFPNLNGIRFIAALMVIISHIELNKSYFNLANNFQSVKYLGQLGVNLFFVLSGFLITFLLIKEKEICKKINLRNFYLRRILRIWPLYYFIILLSLFVLPYIDVFQMPNLNLEFENSNKLIVVVLLFVFFLSNVLISIKLVPFATQTWSIGTEEQFYLIWPIIINNIKSNKNIAKIFILIIISYNLALIFINLPFFDNYKYISLVRNYFILFKLDCLTIGALGAYHYYQKSNLLELITKKYLFIFTLFAFIFLLSTNFQSKYFNSLLYAMFFVIIILNLVYQKWLSQLLENNIIGYLGKISYGLYMYHQITIVFVISYLLKFKIMNDYVLYVLSFLATVLLSSLSYKFIEKPFLRKKNRLSIFNNNK